MHPFHLLLLKASFCFLFLSSASFGQQVQSPPNTTPAYDIRHFTDENGLPQNSVKSIVRDARGNIWLATERGLVRYDGNRFVKFDNLGNSFAARSISGFYLDPQGRPDGLLAMTNNRAWIRIMDGKATIDTALTGYPLQCPINISKALSQNVIEALPDLNESALTFYRETICVIYPATAARYFVYDRKNLGYYVNNKLIRLFPIPNKSFFRFFRLGQSLYYLDQDLKLTRFSGTGGRPAESTLTGPLLTDPAYRSTKQYQIFWNSYSNQAFISTDRRLYFLQPASDGSLVSKLILEGFDFKDKDIKTIFFDSEMNRLFLGSLLHGLYIVSQKQFRTIVNPSEKSDNVYYGQALLDRKKIATLTGAVFSLDSTSLGTFTPRLQLIDKTVEWDKYCIIKDHEGTWWCKRRETLYRFDASGERIIASWKMADEIKQLYQGLNGRIWIGTKSLGLHFIDPVRPDAQPRFFAGKNLSSISWIQHQTAEMLWIGTGKGLYKIHLPSRRISSINKLADSYVRSLYIPAGRDEIWITTYTHGIFLLKKGKLTQLPLDEGQYLAGAHCIVEDKNGYFWITTNKGLFQTRRADLLAYANTPFELYYHYYAKIEGFNTNEFNGGCQPCALKTPGGIVSLPSIDGLVWFVPEQVRPEVPKQQIYLDEPENTDSTFAFDRRMISVKAGVPQIVLNVTTPYFGNPYNLKMSYRLFKDEEPMTEWKVLDETRSIAIPFQGGGDYTLRIRKTNGFGIGNLSERDFSISVEQQWHETGWFISLVVTVILLLFYTILRQRVNVIKRQNLALEIKVRERTEHLEKTLTILSESEKQLEQQVRLHIHMIASISHDIRTPVRHMTYALDYSQNLIQDRKLDSAVSFIRQLKQAVENMYHMVDNLVNFIKPEVSGVNDAATSVKLSDLIAEKVSLFRQIAAVSNADIQVEVSPEEIVFADPKLLGIIVHNLIDNAIKVRHRITLRIYIRYQDTDLHLVFEDNGPGMPPELMKWLNAEEDTTLPAGYEGLGLLLLKQISKLLRINLYVSNSPGACVHLIFKKGILAKTTL